MNLSEKIMDIVVQELWIQDPNKCPEITLGKNDSKSTSEKIDDSWTTVTKKPKPSIIKRKDNGNNGTTVEKKNNSKILDIEECRQRLKQNLQPSFAVPRQVSFDFRGGIYDVESKEKRHHRYRKSSPEERVAYEILEKESKQSLLWNQLPTKENILQTLKSYCYQGTMIHMESLHPTIQSIREGYNDMVDRIGIKNKKDTITFQVRNANNFVKSIMFSKYIPRGRKILDLGCNRGQDIYKLKYSKPEYVLFVDISEKCLFEAEKRWKRDKFPFPATFVQANFCDPQFFHSLNLIIHRENPSRRKGEPRFPVIANVISTGKGAELVDVVSCQFAAHYAFFSRESAQQFIKNVANILIPGGIFIGTAPQGEKIVEKLNENHLNYNRGKFSIWLDNLPPTILEVGQESTSESTSSPPPAAVEKNKSSDTISIDLIKGGWSTTNHSALESPCTILPAVSGIPYCFSMKNTIECKQHVMIFDDLFEICKGEGLELIHFSNLKSEFRNQVLNPKNASLMLRMGIQSDELDEIDSENISMYCTFAFVKKKN